MGCIQSACQKTPNNRVQPRPATPTSLLRARVTRNLTDTQGVSYRLRRSRDVGIPSRRIPPVVVRRGQPATFSVFFNVAGLRHYSIVWIIGNYEISEQTQNFHVSDDGEVQTLHIRATDPTMAGNVVCELRKVDILNRERLLELVFTSLIFYPYQSAVEGYVDPQMETIEEEKESDNGMETEADTEKDPDNEPTSSEKTSSD